jgi:uncharacterized protein (TIGR00730 family)
MALVKTLCVFCGASDDVAAIYRESATKLGEEMAAAGVGLVFGGGRIGLMGLISSAVARGGGKVTGVIPKHLHRAEIGGREAIGELRVVETMHERKALMFALSDAIAVLPGGLGTLDETFEVLTWKQLGLHDKPIVLIDVGGYWAPLIHQIDRVVESGFAPRFSLQLMRIVRTPEEVLPLLASLPEPAVPPPGRFTS